MKKRNTVEDIYPLSSLQQGLLFHALLAPESSIYFQQASYSLRRSLNVPVLKRAWERVMERHTVLRTAFLTDRDRPLQVVFRDVELPFEQHDWRRFSPAQQQERLQEFLRADRKRGFKLARAPLFRLTLIQLATKEYQLIWSHHHLLMDGWSMPLILKEVFAFYEAYCRDQELNLKPPRPFGDYIAWLQKQSLSAAETFWRGHLKGLTAPTLLEIDQARGLLPGEEEDYNEERIYLSTETTTSLEAFARQHGLTLNTLVQGAWALLCSRYSGEEDVIFGITVSGRPMDLAGAESMIGLFTNTLPLRVHVPSQARVIPWLKELQTQQAKARQYEYSPLIDVHKWSEIPSGTPLFENLLVFHSTPSVDIAGSPANGNGAAEIKEDNYFELTSYPLTFFADIGPNLYSIFRIVYDRRRFEAAAIARLLQHFQTLLEAFSTTANECLAELPLLTTSEREQLTELSCGPMLEPAAVTLGQLFDQRARDMRDAVAVVYEQQCLTYGELNRRADLLATYLQDAGIGNDEIVAVCMSRSLELMIALVGVLKAGAAYLPLDASYPPDRLRFMLADANARMLLTQDELRSLVAFFDGPVLCDLPSTGSNRQVQRQTAAENLAYVLYTSGSTGQPKGVALTHRSAVAFLTWAHEVFPPELCEGLLASTSICFDLSIFELLLPLCFGGRVLLVANALALVDEQIEEDVTLINTVPSAIKEVANSRAVPATVRVVNLAGEPFTAELTAQLYQETGIDCLYNLYGPSEATTYSTYTLIEREDDDDPTIGKPIAGTDVYVVDEAQRVLPVGIYGELCIGGAGLARGYLNRPELTAERFVPHPYSSTGGERLYRTGDVVRWNADGLLEFRGRADHQVKVRGYRIELGEIEAALRSCSGVEQAVVLARDTDGDKQLVGYVVSERPVNSGELRTQLSEKLPQYMVPAVIVELAELPLTANGKLDRKALPEPELSGREQEFVAPRTPVEELLAGIFAEVLKLERVGRDENFFALGGHSLLATQVVSRVQLAFAIELPLRALFEAPTVTALAHRVDVARAARRQLSAPPIERVERSGNLPLSFAQARLWFIDQLEPDSAAYNMLSTVRLRGELNVAALRRSFTEVVRRHEVLRTRFVTEGGEPQQIVGASWNVELPVLDLQELLEGERETAAREWAVRQAAQPFVLSEGPLLRVGLARLSEEEHVLALTMHHIISDGWSVGVLIREVSALYEAYSRGEESPLAELAVQYGDFAVWQRDWLQGEVLDQQLRYWREQLAGLVALELPTDRARPAVPSHRGAVLPFSFGVELTSELRGLSQRSGVTPFMTLLAAYQLLLSKYSNQSDIAVGTDVANRNRAETEGLIGFFINQLVLRSEVKGERSFSDLLKQVREVTLGAYEHQDLPFERLVESLMPERDLARAPLFQVKLVMQNTLRAETSAQNLGMEDFGIGSQPARLDVTLIIEEQRDQLRADLEYATDLFDRATMERFISHLQAVLEQVLIEPGRRVSQIEVLTASER
ncbi:MAG TPA: amino acid adenylation domain-containing protein, partial [Pyrinomonadaceae bacterium]|nr:amino acid adenylation domain-containing protein [Pyrinomonadaceae bacterium]